MNDARVRDEEDLPSVVLHPQAVIEVFRPVEDPVVQHSDLLHGLPSNDLAGPDDCLNASTKKNVKNILRTLRHKDGVKK